ncbi:MAG: hypothetical protein OEQ13_13405 [Acidobacteriota bacterium]|nr:hypothetical protein [Acidobacteriota bacterium]
MGSRHVVTLGGTARASGHGRRVALRRGLAAALLVAAASCDSGPEPAGTMATPAFQTTATIEEIMRHLVDPAADAIWESVVTEVTAEGVIDHIPETDEDWASLRGHALTLVESTNLLLMRERRVASPGSRSELPGVDLEPEQIEALLAENRAAWDQFVGGLHTSGLVVLEAVDRRDVEALLVAGDGLDLACENCHVRYWYPSLAEADTAN